MVSISNQIRSPVQFSKETKKDIAESWQEYKEGKVHKWTDIKRELNLLTS